MDDQNNKLKLLQLERNNIRDALSRFATFLNSFAAKPSSEGAKELTQKITETEVLLNKFKNVQIEIETIDPSEISHQTPEGNFVNTIEEFEKEFHSLLSDAENVFHDYSVSLQNNSNNPEVEQVQPVNAAELGEIHNNNSGVSKESEVPPGSIPGSCNQSLPTFTFTHLPGQCTQRAVSPTIPPAFQSTSFGGHLTSVPNQAVNTNNVYTNSAPFITPQTFYNHQIPPTNLYPNYSPQFTYPVLFQPQVPLNIPQVNLPAINLPTFTGQTDDWLSFRDNFESLINFNNTLPKVQKFHYLKACLKGEAGLVIKNLSITNDNYDIAWQLLNERYENKPNITIKHINSMLDFQVIHRGSSHALRLLVIEFKQHMRALENLGQPVKHWSSLLIEIIIRKLDNETKFEWERYRNQRPACTVEELFTVISNRAQLLENSSRPVSQTRVDSKQINIPQKFNVAAKSFVNVHNTSCVYCNDDHQLFQCRRFLRLSVDRKRQELKKLKVCSNCLKAGHDFKRCLGGSCRVCDQNHNTVLHDVFKSSPLPQKGTTQNRERHSETGASNHVESTKVATNLSAIHNNHSKTSYNVLLATALVKVEKQDGSLVTLRALLDLGSQLNFLTEKACTKLDLKPVKTSIRISGINQSTCKSDMATSLTILSNVNSNFKLRLNCQVINTITQDLPSFLVDTSKLQIPDNIHLADPHYKTGGPIDLLIGAEHFFNLLNYGQRSYGKEHPILQNTKLGWVISGKTPCLPSKPNQFNPTSLHCSSETSILNDSLNKFFSQEELSNDDTLLSNEEVACEIHFEQNMSRLDSGHFQVALPFKSDPSKLGDSRRSAEKRFLSLEKRLSQQPDLKKQYIAFMNEYKELGHMSLVQEECSGKPTYYLPHHHVINSNSETTKLRVVFDASNPSNTGVSLNNILLVGPTIQQDLFAILLRFRQHKYVLTADIQKMYRSIFVRETDRKMQRIIWRDRETDPLQCYELKTVTYGTASAPYLATRCLLQLSKDNADKCPVASQTIKNDFYVDDWLTGENTIEELIEKCESVTQILAEAGFLLHKWHSNSPQILPNNINFNQPYELQPLTPCKTLGIFWDPQSDTFSFSVNLNFKGVNKDKPTKRVILSAIAQLFDPLSFVGPVLVVGKILMQKLWELKLNWDEPVPRSVQTEWVKFINGISDINNLKIPRLSVIHSPTSIELHGFSDASQRAYGAVVYIRSKNQQGDIVSNLLTSKSRIAPLKTVTIPRLELCAAHLLVRLIEKVRSTLTLPIDNVVLWTDSTIVLSWLETEPNKLNTFVANRVADIQRTNYHNTFRHVPGSDNPADLISRGSTPTELINSQTWWQGPKWLSSSEQLWPNLSIIDPIEIPEIKKSSVLITTCTDNHTEFKSWLFNLYSSLYKLKRVVALCLRFAHNCKANTRNKPKLNGPLSIPELDQSMQVLVKLSQSELLNEVTEYQHNSHIRTNRLAPLTPFIDKDQIIRVGGRLINAHVQYDQKHPIILPQRCTLTKLIIREIHLNNLHCGVDTTLSICRLRYWPIKGRTTVKSVINSCVRCAKFSARHVNPIMGNLPTGRVIENKPFTVCGVDYAGPFTIKLSKRTCGKAYLCLFVCFATKAVHLELVSDLTSAAFLAALERLIARRGMIQTIYSDNGKTFVGANRELKDFLTSEDTRTKITTFASKKSFEWHFIPAYSPHFGGIWESQIKSAKRLMYKVIGETKLSFEELYTLFVQIEACLNSRPLFPISSDSRDPTPLTPGHFLVGESLHARPQPDLQDVPINRLTRWQHVDFMRQHFWRRWSQNYLQSLQTKAKWRIHQPKIKVGDLVWVRDINSSPLVWPLGRVTVTHPDQSGTVRVVTVKTASGEFVRSVNKILPVPVN